MVQKEYIFRFLRDLRNNNSKEWMDENRERYHTAKDRWIAEVEQILAMLVKHEARFQGVKPKSTLSRINNNRRFHPDRPVYKDYFTCDPDPERSELSLLHISIGPGSSFVGAGLHHPSSETLKKYYEAIDYDGERFRNVIENEKVTTFFGGLTPSDKDLKTAPKGYAVDHPQVELLRKKSITLMRELTNEEVCSDGFVDLLEEAFVLLKPFNAYLHQAISFSE